MANPTPSEDSSFTEDSRPLPDAQGQAALLLLESVIHSLIDNGTLTKQQALEAIESATQVKEESAEEHKEPRNTLLRSLGLLRQMKASIESKSGPYDTGEERD